MAESSYVPKAAILDRWSERDWSDGIQLDELEELDTLAVRTQNSVYEIVVVCGRTGEVWVRGGSLFPERTLVRLSGSTCGGSFLKRLGIYIGMQLELVPEPAEMVSKVVLDPITGEEEHLVGYKAVTTSAVQSIGLVR
jgi:hypothetical protein